MGALFMLAMAACFALGAALVRAISTEVDQELVVFVRYLVGMFFLLPLLASSPVQTLRTRVWHWHLLRGLCGFGALYCYFYALGHIPLAEAVLFVYAAPVFVPLLAKVILKEHSPPQTLWAALIGFAGILLLVNPARSDFSRAHLIGFAATLLGALAFICVRRLTHDSRASQIVFFFTLIGTALGALLLFGSHTADAVENPTARQWLALVAIGALTTLAQWLMSKGYSYGPAASLAPFSYFTIVFGGLLGWWLWQEVPDWPFFAGTLLVLIAAGINLKG